VQTSSILSTASTATGSWITSEVPAWRIVSRLEVRETIGGRIYQAEITLKGIRPPIWRRMHVPGTIRLGLRLDGFASASVHEHKSN
jgi:hypothetical protein